MHALREAEPGTRFQAAHERLRFRRAVVRVTLICVGVTLAVAGAVTFWLPGPNFVLVFAGIAIVAGQWKLVARGLDRLEVAGRRWNDEVWDPYPHKRRVKAIVAFLFVVAVVLVALLADRQGWLPGWLPSSR